MQQCAFKMFSSFATLLLTVTSAVCCCFAAPWLLLLLLAAPALSLPCFHPQE
jgi:hypothetical protein